jgi:hypothetical protein
VITKNLTFDGGEQQVTISGGGTIQVFQVNSGFTLTLKALTIANGNTSSSFGGGGLLNEGGTVTITNSTFSNNSASNGGGLFNNSGKVSITNSTFSNNSASNGGGLFNNIGTVSITNSTFANNSAPSGYGGGLFNNIGSTVNLAQSIVANNTATNGANCNNYNGTINDGGYNLSNDTSCGFTNGGNNDIVTSNPLLAAGLANNGGPTQTIALQSGSPAIDQIPVGQSPSLCTLTSDQRGFPRPGLGESKCSIGAYEFQGSAPTHQHVLYLQGSTSVQETTSASANITRAIK